MSNSPSRTPVPIGTRIMAAIVTSGHTMHEVATLAGMPPATLSNIVQGHSDPKWSSVERIAGALGISTGALLNEEVQTERTA